MATLTTTIEDEHYNHQQNRASHQRNAKIHPDSFLSTFSFLDENHSKQKKEEPSDTIFKTQPFQNFKLIVT